MPPDDQTQTTPDSQQPWDGIERRRLELRRWGEINARLEDGDAVMRKLQDDLANNTLATKRVEEKTDQMAADTSELVMIFRNMKGAFWVLEVFGKVAKPLTALVGLLAAGALAWSNIKGGMK